MQIDEIRKNAPEGSTHWDIDEDEVVYYKNNNGKWYIWERCEIWVFVGMSVHKIMPLR